GSIVSSLIGEESTSNFTGGFASFFAPRGAATSPVAKTVPANANRPRRKQENRAWDFMDELCLVPVTPCFPLHYENVILEAALARVRCGGAVAIGSDWLGIALATVLRKGARVQADHTEFHADRSVRIAAGAAVAAAGVFVSVFILKALPEFAAAAAGDSSWRFRQLALWVVLGGLLGAVLGAWRFRLVGY